MSLPMVPPKGVQSSAKLRLTKAPSSTAAPHKVSDFDLGLGEVGTLLWQGAPDDSLGGEMGIAERTQMGRQELGSEL